MAGFALSCFGLLLFLWLAFGGPIPLQPKGYRFNVSFREAATLSQEADVRISGVSVGKVKVVNARQGDRRLGRDDRARLRVRADPQGHEGDPAPEDAAGRDLRRADARLPERRDGRRERPPAGRRGVADRRARRDLPRLRREDARVVPHLDAAAGARLAGPRARHLRLAGQPRAVRGGHHDAAEDPQRAGHGRAGRGARHRRGLRRPERARRPAALADRELQHASSPRPRRATASSRRPSAPCRPSSGSRRSRSRA